MFKLLVTFLLTASSAQAIEVPNPLPPPAILYPITAPNGPDPWRGIKKTRPLECSEFDESSTSGPGIDLPSHVRRPTLNVCEETYDQVKVSTPDLFIVEDSTHCWTIVRSEKPIMLHIVSDPTAKMDENLKDAEFDVFVDKGAVARIQNCGGFVRVRNLHDNNAKSVFVRNSLGGSFIPVGTALNYAAPAALRRDIPCLIDVPDRRTMDRFIKTTAVLAQVNYYGCR